MTKQELLQTATPILFNTEMVRKILDGTKWKTRRVVKQKFKGGVFDYFRRENLLKEKVIESNGINSYSKEKFWHRPRYKTGDILYVRETFCRILNQSDMKVYVYYKADDDGSPEFQGIKWKPSIHMPKEAARLFLRVTGVRAERLQDISGKDALAEGIDNGKSNPAMGERWENMQRIAFAELWDAQYGKTEKAWKNNPWVWVYEFERVEVTV